MRNLFLLIGLLITTQSFGQLPRVVNPDDQIIEHNGYTLSYNETHEQANWVFYRMDSTDIKCETEDKARRKNNFKEDNTVETGSATLKDYKGSGYDRGHLKASADESCDQTQMDETFYMSNISPQTPGLNRGGWKKLENEVRNLTLTNDSIYVYTGPVLKPSLKTIGESKVSIPEFFFKVIYIFKGGEYKVIAFLMPNKSIDGELNDYRIELITLEKWIGIIFPKTF
jgi:endonuclease G